MAESIRILEAVKNGKCSVEEAQKSLEKLTIKDNKMIKYKISPKGAISFYGLRRIPITLYKEEIDRLLIIMNSDEFKQFIITNKNMLSVKNMGDS